LGSIGYDTFLSLAQQHNVRIVVFFPFIGNRTEAIDTDQPNQWRRLWDEVQVVVNTSLNRAELSGEREGREEVEVWSDGSRKGRWRSREDDGERRRRRGEDECSIVCTRARSLEGERERESSSSVCLCDL
jgi:hypothetical protein